MGVHGLWRLIEPSGKPVPLETLENKILAVDVSIWLHQLVKGFQDSKGAPVPNAHLLGIYHRICKLLYFRIKPVFVFDGGVPVLKKQTMAKRNQQKSKTLSEAERVHRNLLSTLLKHSAINKVLSEKVKAEINASLPPPKPAIKKKEDDLYMLPPSSSLDSTQSSSEDEEYIENSVSARQYDLHSIDTESAQFKSLPADLRHEILTDLKETRKQSSWGRLHELPTQSNDFASYQMKRLMRRHAVQTALEDVEKEMGGHSLSLGELEKILKDQGVITSSNVKGSRIASDENTRFLLIKDIKQAVEDAKKQNNGLVTITEVGEEEEKKEKEDAEEDKTVEKTKNKAEVEYEEDLRKAIALSLEEGPTTSKQEEPTTSKQEGPTTSKQEEPSTSTEEEKTPEKVKVVGGKGKNRMPLSFLEGFTDADFFDSESSEDELTPAKLTPAQRYMMEYSGLTAYEISRIIASNRYPNKKKKEEEKIVTNQPVQSEGNRLDFDTNEKTEKTEGVIDITDAKITEQSTAKIEEEKTEMTTHSEKQITESDKEQKDREKSTTSGSIEIIPIIVKTNVPLKTILTKQKDEETGETSMTESFRTISETEDEKMNEENTAEVEIMSDSESSNEDDFLEVEESSEESKNTQSMEVVIKPDEAVEDDLFKDIFENDESAESNNKGEQATIEKNESPNEKVETTEQTTPKKSKVYDGIDKVFAEELTPEKGRPNLPSFYDKINKVIKSYSTTDESTQKPELSVEKMKEMQQNLSKEEEELVMQRSNKERMAGNITDQMYQEAQELLELFGVPYLIAPMEAEAQCAFLDLINLTDGTITDDSDIWLFGGRTVYKNFFNQSKTVLEFKSESIQQHFKLTREQMILLAMLVGSDYTVGITGVGPVTALEILAAFPSKNELLSGLMEFKSWFNKGKLPAPGRTALRSKLKNVSFTEYFPNPQIAQAYLEPQVETSEAKFSWAKPDVVGLVDFAKQKFGWTKQKSEEILTPILKRFEERQKQKSITDYYKIESKIISSEPETKMSKRVKIAITKIGRKGSVSDDEEEPKPKKKKTINKKENKDAEEKGRSKPKVKKASEKKSKQKVDEELEILKKTEATSEKRLEEIHKEIEKKLEEEKEKKRVNFANLHKREVIPQKQKDKSEMLKNKLKAIETFRKSKQGPGYIKKRGKVVRAPKENASYLSESSDSN